MKADLKFSGIVVTRRQEAAETKFLIHGHAEIEKEVELLEKALFSLRYEGKNAWGRNLGQIHRAVEFFNEKLVKHMAMEEEVLFPFLERSVPKLESLISILRSEHEELRQHLNVLQSLFQKFSKRKRDAYALKSIEMLKEAGIYWIYLLKAHVHNENTSVYQAVSKELRDSERRALAKQIRNYQCCDYCGT